MDSHDIPWDVAIVGGGPAGSTAATLLKKYAPERSVIVIERAQFPREHVGESQLPSISPILAEMGVWDKVETAGFPIKIGASYTWGRNQERWDFDFHPVEDWVDEARPAKFEGQRTNTAFQVDRAIYDKILLDHARELGTEVRENVGVSKVLTTGDAVDGLLLEDGEQIKAHHYIDATGVAALFRRTFGLGQDTPSELKNIAIWDYWENADWAVEIGIGATRVQVRSLPWGWIWFIPLGPTRTSIGLVCPNDYHKKSGKTPAELYQHAIQNQPEIASLLTNARQEGGLQACKDWSHLVDRIAGKNWFITGEAAGFADPILAAGMSLAHSSAREAAYTILELDRGVEDSDWLRNRYNDRNRQNIRQHIRFAQYWYAANGCFTDLQEECRSIARDAGLDLEPQQAWQWLSQGGFTTEQVGRATVGSFDLSAAMHLVQLFDAEGRKPDMLIDGANVFELNLEGVEQDEIGDLQDGHIHRIQSLRRGRHILPLIGYYGSLVQVLKQTSDGSTIAAAFWKKINAQIPPAQRNLTFSAVFQALEVMVEAGWVTASHDPKRPSLRISVDRTRHIRSGQEGDAALALRKSLKSGASTSN